MHQCSSSRRAASPATPKFAAPPAAPPHPSESPDFWSAVAQYERVRAEIRERHRSESMRSYEAYGQLIAEIDALNEAAADVLRAPAEGPNEAIALLSICHSRMDEPFIGVKPGFSEESESILLEPELPWEAGQILEAIGYRWTGTKWEIPAADLDRRFLEAAIDALKRGC